ncbi:hypothetical protein HMPREF1544_10834 [Mucor circinelloides 1006PhL]|uniref:Uncharacterized protein n=1 Tax=Mucor circinelloides f. circinelloides (strain 1006PhL) TaxID=1220926 RepID=S2J2Q6_MUCC1|nr:hypothetical protein HMPREF1544_10834 [Mucor circinelloides 1006PhL]KAG1097266.1 hypothetical protein G6F42_018210 [Rhizopus arrhizus]
MGNVNSADDPYSYGYGYNNYNGVYNGYNSELERYYRRYQQYNAYYPQYAQPNYFNAYQQQQLYPTMATSYASTPYAAAYGNYTMPNYGYNTPVYSSMYNSAPVYGQAYNNGYYPTNYLQRTYI